MYLEVVIKDQVEGTKFAQEKHIFSIFSACTLIAACYLLIEARNLLPPQHKLNLLKFCSQHKLNSSSIYWTSRIGKNQQREKLITYLFETQIEIRLNWYLEDIISHLLSGFLEWDKHSVYAARVF